MYRRVVINMRIFKKKSITTIIAVTILLSTLAGPAYAFSGANNVIMERGINNSVRASFYANRNTGSSPKWGALSNRHIKQCYVKLIEGNYDSGRIHSKEASSKSDNVMKTVYKSRLNHPLHTCYLSYGWNKYF